MSKNIKKYRWFEVVEHGEIFDFLDGMDSTFTAPYNHAGPDSFATHKNRDKSMIKLMRQYGEMLVNGLAEPRDIGHHLIEISDEAGSLEQEVKFGYEIGI